MVMQANKALSGGTATGTTQQADRPAARAAARTPTGSSSGVA
jgi:hypothetical protein